MTQPAPNDTPASLFYAQVTTFSACRQYRYTLWRNWNWLDTSYLMVIGLNPSTADETQDDPTIRRCMDFAKRWGFSGLCMTNLFAWRATDPRDMKTAPNPIGLDNQHHLLQCAAGAGRVLAAWGKHGRFLNMDLTVRDWLRSIDVQVYALKLNKDGSPQHPLYVPSATVPFLLT